MTESHRRIGQPENSFSPEFDAELAVVAGRVWDGTAYIVEDGDPHADDLEILLSLPVTDASRYGQLAERLGIVVVDETDSQRPTA